MFKKSIVDNKIVKEEDFKFPGVKELPRSKQKVLNYIKKMENKFKTKGLSDKDIQTAVYELKDLLRGSIITDSPEETLRVFNAITSMHSARVLLVKNGFKAKEGKQFNPEEYADIKVIFIVGSEKEYE